MDKSILVLESIDDEGINILKNSGFSVDIKLGLSRLEIIDVIGKYDALVVRSQTDVDKDLLNAAKRLKIVARAGVGLDNIDLKVAHNLGIRVINTPSANSIAASELTLGLMLAMARNIAPAHAHVCAGSWVRSRFMGTELHGKNLGLLGLGNVGSLVAMRAHAFGMNVLAYDPYASTSSFQDSMSTKMQTLSDLLANSDFLSLHCILNEHTKHIINEKSIAMMKTGVMLINTARGELIKDEALIKALDSKKIAMAALDVFCEEPPKNCDRLLKHPKILLTPHLGASTFEAQKRVSISLVNELKQFFKCETPDILTKHS